MACVFFNKTNGVGICEATSRKDRIDDRQAQSYCYEENWAELCPWYKLKACKYYRRFWDMGYCKTYNGEVKVDYSTEKTYCTDPERCRECAKYRNRTFV